MPHFAVDESAHAHRKIMRAGNAAFGLWVRFGSYACDHLTDGLIPAEIAAMYGTAPQLRKLASLGMLHTAGHTCERCPQPGPGDYVMHDYLIPNPSRKQVEQRREAAAEKKRKQRSAGDPAANRDRNENDSAPNRRGIDDEKPSNRTPLFDDFAGSEGVSPRDESQTRARPRPSPIPSPPSPEGEGASKQAAHPARGPQVPAFAEPLVEQLTAARMTVGWGLSEPEWFALHAHIKRCGIPALVDFAARRWNTANPPQTARYLLRMWADLPSTPEPGALPALRAVDGPPRPSTKAQEYLADMAAIAAELRAAEGGTA
jgi:hypothetical protein